MRCIPSISICWIVVFLAKDQGVVSLTCEMDTSRLRDIFFCPTAQETFPEWCHCNNSKVDLSKSGITQAIERSRLSFYFENGQEAKASKCAGERRGDICLCPAGLSDTEERTCRMCHSEGVSQMLCLTVDEYNHVIANDQNTNEAGCNITELCRDECVNICRPLRMETILPPVRPDITLRTTEAVAHNTTETLQPRILGFLFWIIVFMVVFLTIMVLVIFIIIRFGAVNLNREIENIYENNGENIHIYSELESEVDIMLKDKEVSNDKVILLEMLGKGEFGVVYKGVVHGIRGTNEEVICAVKMPKVGALNDNEAKEYLLSEMKLLADLGDHQNILSLLACCSHKEPYYLVTEFMKYGDLLTFLRKCRKKENAERDPTYDVEETRQVFIAYQIASGMAYIEEKRFYHGDLAARNILVGDNLTIKISDFGLADDIYTRGYKRREVEQKIPIKWCSLETILKGICTSQGDVWSFGVLLYEVFTLGGTPYPGLAARYLVSQLRKGYRMEQSEDCPDDIYELMLSCWKEDPHDRPTFHLIREQLDDMLVKRFDYLEVEQEDETFNDTAEEGDHSKRAYYMSYIFKQNFKYESAEKQRGEGAAAVERFAPILEEENDIELTELETILHNEH